MMHFMWLLVLSLDASACVVQSCEESEFDDVKRTSVLISNSVAIRSEKLYIERLNITKLHRLQHNYAGQRSTRRRGRNQRLVGWSPKRKIYKSLALI